MALASLMGCDYIIVTTLKILYFYTYCDWQPRAYARLIDCTMINISLLIDYIMAPVVHKDSLEREGTLQGMRPLDSPRP